MMKRRVILFTLCFLVTALVYAQTDTIMTGDGQFWTLPAAECGGDNFCEIRISPEGTIYSWDITGFMLYISRRNTESYETHNLSQYAESLVFAIDFVPFDEQEYVLFYSPVGASRALTRYSLNSQTADVMQFPSEFRLVGCNRYTGENQRELRFIFRMGLANKLMACTDSPQNKPLIQIIDVDTLSIEFTLDLPGDFYNVIEPSWHVLGGLDNRIYALIPDPETVIVNLPTVNESSEAVILVYDLSQHEWSYRVVTFTDYPGIMVAALPDGTWFFRANSLNQYSTSQLLRQIDVPVADGTPRFIGLTLDGYVFLGGLDPVHMSDFPLLVSAPTANAGPDQTLTAATDGFATVTLDGSASFDLDGEIISYVWTLDDVEIATGDNPTVTLEVGEHVITLTVTDDDSATASDTVTITVVAASTPTPTVTITPTDTPTATLTPTYTPTPSQVCDFNVAAGDALGLVNAVNAANNNGASADTICLEEGTYTFASASNAIALPSIATPITIVGNSAIIERGSGAPNFRLFNVTSSGALTLEDLTIRNGNASGSNGGAILNAGSLTLNGVTLADSSARFGGGIHNSGSLIISDSTLVTNSAVENGGAVYVNSGTLALSDTTLESSSARYGSGVYLNNGTADLTGVIARANHATEQGAGVYQRTGTLTISGGLFESNTARFGNGVYVDAGTATISDVTMRENVAVEEGAGIYNRTGTVSVTDCDFENNQARYGAAISNRGTVSVAGSVFTGNIAQESGGAVYTTRSTSGNQVQQSCFEGNTGRFGGAVFSSASGFNARDNWWGAATGPTGAMVNANVLTEPFLTDGCPQ